MDTPRLAMLNEEIKETAIARDVDQHFIHRRTQLKHDPRICDGAIGYTRSMLDAPIKWCARTAPPKDAFERLTKSSALPSNHVVWMVAPGANNARSRSNRPVSRHNAHSARTDRISSRSAGRHSPARPPARHVRRAIPSHVLELPTFFAPRLHAIASGLKL